MASQWCRLYREEPIRLHTALVMLFAWALFFAAFPAVAADLDVATDTTLGGGVHGYDTVTVRAGATLTLDSATTKTAVTLSAKSITVEAGGAISANGEGYPLGKGPNPAGGDDVTTFGGASHGGRGMPLVKPPSSPDLAHDAYGSARDPSTLGASGYDALGGGAIRIEVSGTLSLAGTISANGQSDGYYGGAGGSVYVAAGHIEGAGSVLADGGAGTVDGGGGGRIAIHYVTSAFTGAAYARGGTGTGGSAEDGTAGFFEEGARMNFTAGHSWRFQDNDAPFRFYNITLRDANVGVEANVGTIAASNRVEVSRSAEDKASRVFSYPPYTEDYLDFMKGSIHVSAKDIVVDAGCAIDATGKGYRASVGGPGAPVQYYGWDGGAGYGGKGAGTGGLPYGSATLPTDLGSCAVAYLHYNFYIYLIYTNAGGGAVYLEAENSFALDGDLLANGYSTWHRLDQDHNVLAGNSGGSVLVKTGTFSGVGRIEAKGSKGVWGGGGGRVAVHYITKTFSGTMHATGGESISTPGQGRAPGADGTVVWVQQTPITLGGAYEGDFTPSSAQTFRLDWPGGASTLLLRLTPEDTSESWSILGAYGQLPLTTDYDWTGYGPTIETPPTIELLAALNAPGSYYFAPFTNGIMKASTHFELECVEVQRHVPRVALGSGGTGGSTTIRLAGAGLSDGASVQLLRGSGSVLRTVTPANCDSVSASVTFDLSDIQPQTLSIAVVWPGGPTVTIPGAFVVIGAMPPKLTGKIDIASQVRRLRPTVFWVEVSNTGSSDMPAPILRVENDQGLAMRLSSDDPYEYGGLLLVAINDKNPVTVLPPGAKVRFPVEYFPVGAPHTTPKFQVDKMTGTGEAVDWASVEEQARPDGITDSAWSLIWGHFTSQVGSTWAALGNRMRADAAYLASQGRPTYDVGRLFALELSMAAGATGVQQPLVSDVDAVSLAEGSGLIFARFATNTIDTRAEPGPLGRGWTHNFQYSLEFRDPATKIVHGPGGYIRRFVEAPTGRLQPEAGDYGSLTQVIDGYSLKDPGGLSWQFDTNGRLVSMADMNNNTIAFGYTGENLTTLTHSNGDVFTFSYDGGGRIHTLTDHVGRPVTYGYTGDLLTSVSAPPDVNTQYEYLPQGFAGQYAISKITFPNQASTTMTYDSYGRLLSRRLSGDTEAHEYTYPSIGRVTVQSSAPGASPSEMAFDGDEHLLELASPLGNTLGFGFSNKGAMTGLILPDGTAVSVDYDANGNVMSSTDPLGNTTSSACNQFIRAFNWVLDPLGRLTTFGHDSGGNLRWITYPDKTSTALDNDAMGNATKLTTRQGTVITYARNARGQVTEKRVNGVLTVQYFYDAKGRPTKITDASGDITMTFDDADRMTSIFYPNGHSLTFEYNGAGQRTKRTGDDGYVVNYTYDAAGHLYELRDAADALIVRYDYYPSGHVSSESKGNGTYTLYDYDEDGRLSSVAHYSPGDQVQSSFSYTYDANGRRSSMAVSGGRTEQYTYDAAGQITAVDYGDSTTEAFVYDAVGNRIGSTSNGTATAYAINDLNQYTQAGAATYIYDTGGNLLTKKDADGTTRFEYDAEDRLYRVTTPDASVWTFTYDALGNRCSLTHNAQTTSYIYDPATLTDLAAEYGNSGALTARYIVGKSLAALIDGSGNAAYYGFDGTGNTRQITNSAGEVVNTDDYTIFGSSRGHTGSFTNHFTFGGAHGTLQEPFGIVQMRARDYDPIQGRFTTPDPVDIAGGINLYTYAFNDPVNRADPTGLTVVQVFGVHVEVGLKDDELKKLRESRGQDLKNYGACGDTRSLRLNTVDDINTNIPQAATDTGVDIASNTIKICTGSKAVDVVKGAITSPAKKQVTNQLTKQLSQWWKKKVTPAVKGLKKKVTAPSNPTVTWSVIVTGLTEIIAPADPNEKVGPVGVGTDHKVRLSDYLDYTIYFENKSDASAPAQEVFVSDVLTPYLDLTTVVFTEIAWGDYVVSIPPDATSISARESITDYRADNGSSWFVDVTAQVDSASGQVSWHLRTLDPQTLDLPTDPLAGFLPANDDTHRGEGHVSFRVKPKADAGLGVVMRNQARIVFDSETAIDTNQVTNKTGEIYIVDVDASGATDAVDVQTVINGVLGLLVNYDCDVNGDGALNALDVQLVINGALGLLPADKGSRAKRGLSLRGRTGSQLPRSRQTITRLRDSSSL